MDLRTLLENDLQYYACYSPTVFGSHIQFGLPAPEIAVVERLTIWLDFYVPIKVTISNDYRAAIGQQTKIPIAVTSPGRGIFKD